MKSKNILCGLAMAVVLQSGMLAGSAQTNIYLYTGTETNITLPPGTYIITAYGAPGGYGGYGYGSYGGLGAEMSGEFSFSTPTNLTLLVGEGGGASLDGYPPGGGGGGSGSFVFAASTPPLVIAGGGGGGGGGIDGGYPGGSGKGGGGTGPFGGDGGGGSPYPGGSGGYPGDGGDGYPFLGGGGGGGGSIIGSSAITNLAEVSGIYSPDDYYNGEIIIIALPPPLAITAAGANVVLTWPAADTGFTTTGYTLECATNLVPPVAWQTNATTPIVISGQNTVTNPISGTQMFFRLSQ